MIAVRCQYFKIISKSSKKQLYYPVTINMRDYILRSPSDTDNAPAFVQRAMKWAKGTNELHGLIRGILADGVVNEKEATAARQWFRNNPDTLSDLLVKRLFDRLERVFSDGIVTQDELCDLREIFSEYTGSPDEAKPASLPLDQPVPDIDFPNRSYCFTGTFVSGKRNWCADQTANRGGLVTDSISRDLYALVIGSKVSQGWANQSYGRKIEKAVLLKDEQKKLGIEPVKIICEEHWVKYLS